MTYFYRLYILSGGKHNGRILIHFVESGKKIILATSKLKTVFKINYNELENSELIETTMLQQKHLLPHLLKGIKKMFKNLLKQTT